MGGFPQLPSSYNPYVGEAAQFATGAAHAYNAVQEAKRQQAILAQRAAARKAAQDQRDTNDLFRAYAAGAVPVEGPGDQVNDPGYITKDPGAAPGTPGNVVPVLRGAQGHQPLGYNRPGFTAPPQQSAAPANPSQSSQMSLQPPAGRDTTPAPSGRDPNRMMQIAGRWFYFPTKEEIAEGAGETLTFDEALANEANKAGFRNIRPNHPYPRALAADIDRRIGEYHRLNDPKDQTYTPHEMFDQGGKSAGIYGLGNRGGVIQYPVGQQAGGSPGGPFDASQAAAAPDYRLPIPSELPWSSGAAGIPGGDDPFATALAGPATPTAAPRPQPAQRSAAPAQPAGGLTMRPPVKEPKKTLHWEQSTDDRGTRHVRAFDEDGILAKEYAYPGEGKATKQTGGEKPVSRTALVGIEKTKTTALANAYKAYKKATSDPLADDDAKASAAADLKSAYQDAQNAYEAELTAATGHDIEHDDWADRMGEEAAPEAPGETPETPAAAPAAQAAQPAAAPAQAKAAKRAPVGPPKAGAGPPPDVVKSLKPGVHTFGNGQVWKKNRDGSMAYVSGGQ